jgi:hypothetical protein
MNDYGDLRSKYLDPEQVDPGSSTAFSAIKLVTNGQWISSIECYGRQGQILSVDLSELINLEGDTNLKSLIRLMEAQIRKQPQGRFTHMKRDGTCQTGKQRSLGQDGYGDPKSDFINEATGEVVRKGEVGIEDFKTSKFGAEAADEAKKNYGSQKEEEQPANYGYSSSDHKENANETFSSPAEAEAEA